MLMMAFSNGFAPVLEHLYNIKKYTTSGYYVIFAAGCQSIALCGLEKIERNWIEFNALHCAIKMVLTPPPASFATQQTAELSS